MRGLSMSRGAVSMACKELRDWGLVTTLQEPGVRRARHAHGGGYSQEERRAGAVGAEPRTDLRLLGLQATGYGLQALRFLPLPLGEGRGEGQGYSLYSPDSSDTPEPWSAFGPRSVSWSGRAEVSLLLRCLCS